MKYLLTLIVGVALLMGCAKDAEAGDPVRVQTYAAPQQQVMMVDQTYTVCEPVQEQYEVSVTKTRMVPEERTVTVMVPEEYTETEVRTRTRMVPRQMTRQVAVCCPEPVAVAYAAPAYETRETVYRAAPLRTCLNGICDRHRERKAARRAALAPRTMVVRETVAAPKAYGYGIEK